MESSEKKFYNWLFPFGAIFIVVVVLTFLLVFYYATDTIDVSQFTTYETNGIDFMSVNSNVVGVVFSRFFGVLESFGNAFRNLFSEVGDFLSKILDFITYFWRNLFGLL